MSLDERRSRLLSLANLEVLRERNFRWYYLGNVTSALGSAMVPVALVFAVLEQEGSTRAVGLVLGAESVPLVVLLLLGGVIADRLPRRAVMIAADVVRCAGQAVLCVLLFTDRANLVAFVAVAVLLGAGGAVFNPASLGIVPEVTSAERLREANALATLSGSTVYVVGPAVAGILVAAGSPAVAIGIDAATYAVSAVSLALLRLPERSAPPEGSLWQQAKEGWAEFRRHTWLWVTVAQSGVFSVLCVAPFMVLGPAVAESDLGGARAWGLILSAATVGAVLGGLIALRTQVSRPMVLLAVCSLVYAVTCLLLAIGSPAVFIGASMFVHSLLFSIFDAQWRTAMHRYVAPDKMSRVSALDGFGMLLLMPIGLFLAGVASEQVGTAPVLGVAAIGAAFCGLVVVAVPEVRRLRT